MICKNLGICIGWILMVAVMIVIMIVVMIIIVEGTASFFMFALVKIE